MLVRTSLPRQPRNGINFACLLFYQRRVRVTAKSRQNVRCRQRWRVSSTLRWQHPFLYEEPQRAPELLRSTKSADGSRANRRWASRTIGRRTSLPLPDPPGDAWVGGFPPRRKDGGSPRKRGKPPLRDPPKERRASERFLLTEAGLLMEAATARERYLALETREFPLNPQIG